MLGELAAFLNRRDAKDLLGQFVVLSDSQADGGYLLQHFLSQALKDGHAALLVSFTQSFIHYNSIAAKLGVNLTKCRQAEQLFFVDCLTKLLDNVFEKDSECVVANGGSTKKESAAGYSFSLGRDCSLQALYKCLQELVGELKASNPDRPVCLVVDGLSVVMSVGVSLKSVVDFMHYCQQMLCAPDGLCQADGYLVAMVHCEGDEGEGEEEAILRTHLLHRCHLSLHVEGLRTGYSRDVHGELTAEWRTAQRDPLSSRQLPLKKQSQFRLSDRTLQLFARGTSRAVL